MIPGEYHYASDDPIDYNKGYEAIEIEVKNSGDRAVQVGSHFHFYEANSGLIFDREKAYGKRLDIPAGTAIRFEPGEVRRVPLIDFGGSRRVYGFNNKVNGYLDLDKHAHQKEGE
jgi:urease subunit beta